MKIVRIVIAIFLLLFLMGKLALNHRLRDRHTNYSLHQQIKTSTKGKLQVGCAAVSITPEITDTWTDVDNNARFEPEKGDSYQDNNNNGVFDAIWIAGFHNRRPANGIHDSLWARTMIIDDGTSRIAIVSLDAIGFFHDQLVDVRKKLSSNLGIDYCMIASTHVHEAPDLMGIWGESDFKSGVNPKYQALVIDRIVSSIENAVCDMEFVSLHFAKNENDALPLVTDTRKPIVHDPGMYLMQARSHNGSVKGTLVSWANHPETLWSNNLYLTSDFPHYLRESIEKEYGGICVYINGAIGGLITTDPSVAISHPESGITIKEACFEKAEAQGLVLAQLAIKAIQNSSDSIDAGCIQLQAKTFTLPFKNKWFRIGTIAGILDRGMTGKWQVRTEMAAWKIGPASFLTIPGEIYPEIINGGIEAPMGQDFKLAPVEVPPLREVMSGDYKFVFGMSNDELGYIIPQSEWDHKAPWTYGNEELYGEENSLGPETAPIIHKTALELLNQLK